MVACLSVLHIWTRCCKFVFQQHKLPCGEPMVNIRFKLVAWPSEQYESIQRESYEVEMTRLKFMLKWGGSPMMVKSSTGPKWNYQAPRWLFPSPTLNIV